MQSLATVGSGTLVKEEQKCDCVETNALFPLHTLWAFSAILGKGHKDQDWGQIIMEQTAQASL